MGVGLRHLRILIRELLKVLLEENDQNFGYIHMYIYSFE